MVRQKETPSLLKFNHAAFQEILDGVGDPFYIIDVQTYQIVFANQAAQKIGLLPPKKCYTLTHHASRPCEDPKHICPIKKILASKKPCREEHLHQDPDGTARVYTISAYPLFDDSGQLKQIIEHLSDITEQRNVETILKESERRYRQLYEGSRDGYALVDIEGRIVEFNQAFMAMLGYSETELKALTYQNITPSAWHEQETAVINNQVLVRGYSEIFEKEYIHKDGHVFPVELRIYLDRDHQGLPSGMWAFVRDITERKESEARLRLLQNNLAQEHRKLEKVLAIEQKMRSILNLNHLVDFVIDKATEILEVQKCSLMLLDAHSQELVIRGACGLAEDIVSSTRVRLGEGISGQVAKQGTPLLVNDVEKHTLVARPNRATYQHPAFLCAPIKVQNRIIGVVNVADKKDKNNPGFIDTDLKILNTIVHQAAVAIENANYYQQLEYLSMTDPLTDIYNYRFFTRALDREIARAHRYKNPLCLLMLDVDNFKAYNDSWGHPAGDLLLKKISKVLKDNLRCVDILCRYAGDEFVVILPETPVEQARQVAERIQKWIEALDPTKKVTASIGVGKLHAQADRRDLILKSDQALYQAKREGKNRVCCFQ